MSLRIGQGLDAHPLVAGRRCVLGGVEIPSDAGPEGHSDGDVVLHALADALLGAAAAGDLGSVFGTTDPRFRDAPSSVFVTEALARAGSPKVVNVDVTLIAERPRVGTHRDAMRAVIAALLGIPVERVSVKASSGNGMTGFGRGEGVFASAVVLVEVP
ncbi:MAG TPA: 2-C-methyl-D-erythritol 2,4-cyclodiphosphate synthase [Thermoanaerobaculia bacterium]|nr:2-C-methyl-D-erythritol 2,4-cyclodiphosphate synthase [Thermoanaerobaculia bacterium]HPA51918.1 2-C-methyl-D-erythritol 2,4-cyclodiphosphate synthase [Thermoanaerobaculia bacterium]HQN09723.1 2-C-methyl-D-erythritol 2,4-cyclodiphosphate synthase [Thermoanaerobaculia bacterium]HQP87748.1 2-C-methyl-D-erythritol 2,4-cyclodiphosphate synthase [Thermoanaerobaculia bacterium]